MPRRRVKSEALSVCFPELATSVLGTKRKSLQTQSPHWASPFISGNARRNQLSSQFQSTQLAGKSMIDIAMLRLIGTDCDDDLAQAGVSR